MKLELEANTEKIQGAKSFSSKSNKEMFYNFLW